MEELIVRGSEYQSFLNCRKQWLYQWVEDLEPARPDGKLFFGTVFHKWLEFYYNSGCDRLQAYLETSVWFNKQNTYAMPEEDVIEVKELLGKIADNYDNTYGHNDRKWNILATELEFLVKLNENIFMTGTIDLVYEVDGKIRFADHKTVSSLSMYVEKAQMDRQISRYWWALEQIAKGVGKVKDRTTENDRWISFPDLEGREISGFDYNLIAKDYPKEPKVLKSGKLSTDKSQRTTYAKYVKKLIELNLSPEDYQEMLTVLADKPDPFLQRVKVYRTQKELTSAAYEFLYTASDIQDVRDSITRLPQLEESKTYRNIGHHCETMCSFRSLCKTEIEGGNVSLVKNLGYKKRGNK